MSTTKNNKKERWEEISKGLKLWEIEFIKLKTLGYKYEEIADRLRKGFRGKKFSDVVLRQLIYKDGRLNEHYNAYYELAAEESLEEGKRILENATSSAAMTQVNLLNKVYQGNVRLGASKEILDRTLGRATQPVDIKDDRMMQELEEKVNSIFEDNGNTTRIANRIKNPKRGTSKGKKTS
ncbi:MAG: hypothetical protein WC906_04255 [Parcubacteria group bacterium]|jgi:hypothetical protein